MGRNLLLLVFLGALVGGLYFGAPPPAPIVSSESSISRPIRGAIHVHTRRSDGTGTMETVAEAASAAGLQFVIVTDHGPRVSFGDGFEGIAPPDPPTYYGEVLVIDAVEITTEQGHLVALGLPKFPYRLGGEARDVVEDINRLGGFSIAAHPVSKKPSTEWKDWDVPLEGIELLNGDSAWRDESIIGLTRVLLGYPFRSAEALALLLDRPEEALRLWDTLLSERKVIGIASADAHARIGTSLSANDHPDRDRYSVPLPSYEAIFKTFSIGLPKLSLIGEAEHDAIAVIEEVRAGRLYTLIDGVARSGALSFSATSGDQSVIGGEELIVNGPATILASVAGPLDTQISLVKNGQILMRVPGPTLEYQAGEEASGVYRVEIDVPLAPGSPPVPWIISNPIYVKKVRPSVKEPPFERVSESLPFELKQEDWSIESSSLAEGALDLTPTVEGFQLLFRYALSGEEKESSAYVAAAVPVVKNITDYDALTFSIRSDKPARVSVQLRALLPNLSGPDLNAKEEGRWRRSVYVDTTPRTISLRFDDMKPVLETLDLHPSLNHTETLLFVIDTVNTLVGSSGSIGLEDLRYEKIDSEEP